MNFNYDLRWERLIKAAGEIGLEAILVSDPADSFYLTGAPEPMYPSGRTMLLINTDEKKGYMILPLLEVERMEDEIKVKNVDIIGYTPYEKGIDKLLNMLKDMGVKRLGVEEEHISDKMVSDIADKCKVEVKAAGFILKEMRAVKDDAEVKAIKRAIEITSKAITTVVEDIKEGSTEAEIAAELARRIFQEGARLAFDIIVASGPRGAYPHGIYSCKKVRKGEAVVVDVGARINGYCADTTRMILMGKVEEEIRDHISYVEEAIDEAIKSIRDGVRGREVDEVAREVLRKRGIAQYFTHSLGHGVGIEVHEGPTLGPTSEDVLKEGMITTIEPGIYIKGRYGIRIEEMVLVTKRGCEVLTRGLSRVFDL